jgi:hypothetical protein
MKFLFVLPVFLLTLSCSSSQDSLSESSIVSVDTSITFPVTTNSSIPPTRPTVTYPQRYTEPPSNGYQPALFHDYIDNIAPDWSRYYTDENLMKLALISCDLFDQGITARQYLVNTSPLVEDVNPKLADSLGLFARGVILYICPENMWVIEQISS